MGSKAVINCCFVQEISLQLFLLLSKMCTLFFLMAVMHWSRSTLVTCSMSAQLVPFVSSGCISTILVFNQPPGLTQPGHPSRVGKMSTAHDALEMHRVSQRKLVSGYSYRSTVHCHLMDLYSLEK